MTFPTLCDILVPFSGPVLAVVSQRRLNATKVLQIMIKSTKIVLVSCVIIRAGERNNENEDKESTLETEERGERRTTRNDERDK